MPLFLTADAIKNAIEGLASAGIAPSLTDYLIFKRAFVVASNAARANGDAVPDSVTTGTSTPTFVTAVHEVAGTSAPSASTWDGQTFFSPFGANRDKGLGFKSKKYPSNGPSDTVARWQSRPERPLQIIEGTSPKQYAFVQRSAEELTNYFRPNAANGPLPSLLDLAIWWHRFTDVEAEFGHEPTAAELIERTVAAFGFSDLEVAALFITPGTKGDEPDAAI